MMLIGTRGYNYLETSFTTISVLLTVGVFAYVIQSIGQILEDINKYDKVNKLEVSLINKYLKKKKIDPVLKDKILDYLDQIHE
jgi:hypothetical protein